MAGLGAGYDLSVSTFSPDGRVFQVEYAAKAVDNGVTTLALQCADGVVFAVEKYLHNPMAVPGTGPSVLPVARHAAIAFAGSLPDGRELATRARAEAAEYRRVFDEEIPGRVLADRLALFVQAHTLAWTERPFGAAALLAVAEATRPGQPRKLELYSLDVAGSVYRYFGMALGKGRHMAKTELEKIRTPELTCEEALIHVAKIIHKAHEDAKERQMELELAILPDDERDGSLRHVPLERILALSEEAKRLSEAEENEEPPAAPISAAA